MRPPADFTCQSTHVWIMRNNTEKDQLDFDCPTAPADKGLLRETLAKVTAWVWCEAPGKEFPLLPPARQIVQILYIFLREAKRDRINLRASALTFTVVLSLVPVLALGTAVLKGLGKGDQIREAAYHLIDRMEKPVIAVETVEQDSTPDASPLTVPPPAPLPDADIMASTAETPSQGLTSHLHNAVDQIFDYVDRTNFATLGAFGIVGLVMAVLSMLGSIEQAMNSIWQADSGRPFGRKIMDYLALVILLPVTVNIALAVEATMHSPALLNRLQTMLPMFWLQNMLLNVLPFVAVIATFTILYQFLPNTKVRFLPALVGGLCGGISWLLIQILYVKLQIGVARYNAIYGSFATLPLLLLWLQMAWFVFLAGAEVAYAIQTRPDYTWRDTPFNPVTRLALAFTIMETIMGDFTNGGVTCSRRLSEKTKQPANRIRTVIDDLLDGGKIRQVTGKIDGFVPAVPMEGLQAAEIVDLIFGTDLPELSGSSLASEARQAAHTAMTDRKICCTKLPDCNTFSNNSAAQNIAAHDKGV